MGEPLTPEALGAIRARRDGAVRLAMRERLAERAQRGSWSATAAVALGIMDEDAADIAALLAEVERLRAIVRDVRPLVEAAAVERHYGFPWAGLPAADFDPDAEACTDEERAAHAAALAAEAVVTPEDASGWLTPDVHVTRSPWGIGTITTRDEAMAALLARIDGGSCG